jgi:hypothetical protein
MCGSRFLELEAVDSGIEGGGSETMDPSQRSELFDDAEPKMTIHCEEGSIQR